MHTQDWLDAHDGTFTADEEGPEMRPSWEVLVPPEFFTEQDNPAYLAGEFGDRYDEESFP